MWGVMRDTCDMEILSEGIFTMLGKIILGSFNFLVLIHLLGL